MAPGSRVHAQSPLHPASPRLKDLCPHLPVCAASALASRHHCWPGCSRSHWPCSTGLASSQSELSKYVALLLKILSWLLGKAPSCSTRDCSVGSSSSPAVCLLSLLSCLSPPYSPRCHHPLFTRALCLNTLPPIFPGQPPQFS